MTNPFNSMMRFVAPLLISYLAYNFFGFIGGLITIILYLLVSAYLNRGSFYQSSANKKYHKGDYEGAIKDLKTAVEKDAKNVKIRGTYAFVLLKLGYTSEARVQIEEALKTARLEDDKNTMRVTKALVMWKENKVDEAINELTDLIKTYETTNVYATLGFLYIQKGDINKALEFNLEAKDYNSSSAIILDNLGTVYFLMGEYDKAYDIYQDVMKAKPVFPEAFYNYARVLEKKDDLEKALYMLRHSLTLKFWNTSTIKKEEVEAYLIELEEKEKELQQKEKEQQNYLDGAVEKNIETENEIEETTKISIETKMDKETEINTED